LFYVLPIRAYFRDCVYVYNPGSLPNNRACIAIPPLPPICSARAVITSNGSRHQKYTTSIRIIKLGERV